MKVSGGLYISMAPTTPSAQTKRNAAKLTIEQVKDIRARYAAGTAKRTLAEEFGVTRMAIHWVVLRRTWADVE